jgi:membrane complex biogenesis BtpA family protein
MTKPSSPRLIGMVHLGPLPGAPAFDDDFEGVLERAVADALVLADTGFDALMIENYGDVPFFADTVPAVTVAAMARAVATIRAAVSVPLGVNVLRNDGLAALSIAASCGAQFIRVNVLAGAMFTDQGLVNGRAAELMRARSALGPEIEVLADVHVKHAVAPSGLSIEEAAADTYHRGLADALIVSGVATGKAPDQRMIDKVRKAVPDAPLLAGSGTTRRSVRTLLDRVDGVIAGTDLKFDGVVENPVDPKRAQAMVDAARRQEPGAGTAETTSSGSKGPASKGPASKSSGAKSSGAKTSGAKSSGAKGSDAKTSDAKTSSSGKSGARGSSPRRSGTRRSGSKTST